MPTAAEHFESLERMLPEVPVMEAAHHRKELATRAIELLVRREPTITLDQVKAKFGAGLRGFDGVDLRLHVEESFLAASLEQKPDSLANLLKTQTAPTSRTSILCRAIRLGWFDAIAATGASWDTKTFLLVCPFDDAEKASAKDEVAVSRFFDQLRIRHPVVYRATARRGDVTALEVAAVEAWSLPNDDVNGGFAKTFIPWAFGSVLKESAKLGHVELACDAIAKAMHAPNNEAVISHAMWADLLAEVALGAARNRRFDVAERLLTEHETTFARHDTELSNVRALVHLSKAGDIRGALAVLPTRNDALLGKDLLWASCWEMLEAGNLKAAHEILRFAASSRQDARNPQKFDSDMADITLRLCRKHCAAGAFREAVSCADQLVSGGYLRSTILDIAYEAAMAGEVDYARGLLGSSENNPLVTKDLASAPLPSKVPFDRRLFWVVLALESLVGRSTALTGYGIPERW